MDVVGQGGEAEFVGLAGLPAELPRPERRSVGASPAVAALPAGIAALLLAHRIELEIDACELFDAQLREAAPPVIDARILRAWRAGHIPGSVHLTAEQVTRCALMALPAAPYVVVYGADATRLDAVRCAHAIAELGFPVKLLTGGIAAWVAQGFPLGMPARSEGRIAAL
ncbi:rhodanese-like domain-containing protein [Sphingomonas sp.]|uniref:rhodanese-like domain-containing protein n=1 Tax=Sphingomonas sp. TaxID=28214 RepID=UPI001B2BB75F|nr:rhodanese-like domain-containing protein [Sphingomonas sp.]MBO9713451.1 hypothetical protein [Sphingomonas sp.]